MGGRKRRSQVHPSSSPPFSPHFFGPPELFPLRMTNARPRSCPGEDRPHELPKAIFTQELAARKRKMRPVHGLIVYARFWDELMKGGYPITKLYFERKDETLSIDLVSDLLKLLSNRSFISSPKWLKIAGRSIDIAEWDTVQAENLRWSRVTTTSAPSCASDVPSPYRFYT
jgi:hypothetical protein